MNTVEIRSRNPLLFERLDKSIAAFELWAREHHANVMCLHRYFSTECCEELATCYLEFLKECVCDDLRELQHIIERN